MPGRGMGERLMVDPNKEEHFVFRRPQRQWTLEKH